MGGAKKMKPTRKTNIELLRIFAMLLIIGSHLVCHGVQNVLSSEAYVIWNNGKKSNLIFSSFLSLGGQVGVAIFFMITGFFGVSDIDKTIRKCVRTCLFYGCLIVSIFGFTLLFEKFVYINDPMTKMIYIVKNICNPMSSGEWWFITAYGILILLSPIINKYVERKNQKQYRRILCIYWIIWYTIAYFVNASYIGLERGIFFYLIGLYYKKYGVMKKTSKYIYIYNCLDFR